jgi:hypothetical protein
MKKTYLEEKITVCKTRTKQRTNKKTGKRIQILVGNAKPSTFTVM